MHNYAIDILQEKIEDLRFSIGNNEGVLHVYSHDKELVRRIQNHNKILEERILELEQTIRVLNHV